ncbi:hypothetical protein [Henriciella sp.]|uniref:hypothetical protein n=1 Tax=Henriciella sp. TaxID=1968823 RepID=UPI00261DCAAC|nr:hypothetical protein [Henriciella sp.]
MSVPPSYLTREGRVSLAGFPEGLCTVEALEHYIAHIADDLKRQEQDHLDRIAVRKVAIQEVVQNRSKVTKLGILQDEARRRLRALQDRE